MRVIMDIDERFAGVLSITAIRSSFLETCVSAVCVDLKNGQYVCLENNGHFTQNKQPPKEEV